MIQIRDKSKCCGCAACVQRCPKQCISFKKDSEGFLYPEADASLCIECRLCEKVCPILQEPHSHIPKQCYAAINPNEDVRKNSSSGGIFTAIATTVLSEGGVVFGARFDTDWSVIHDHTETLEGLAAFQGSKYLQSRVGNTYQQAEKFLKEGRKVLFSGTPCQISGLHHFLRKEYSNLLTVDFICHGVPSPSVWQQYLLETKKQHSIEQITNISFRNKSNGWKKYRFTIEWINHKKEKNIFSEFSYQNIYMKGFLKDIYLRPSCYSCPVKPLKGCSYITIGDFWGIEKILPDFDDDKGSSCVIIQTIKGINYFDHLKIKTVEVKYNTILQGNPSLEKSTFLNKRKKETFFRSISKLSLKDNIEKQIRPSLYQKTINKLRKTKRRIKMFFKSKFQ